MKLKKPSLIKTYPYILIVGGLLGLFASFSLTMEKLAILKNPNAQLACNLNPILSCGSVISTNQATAFGFPNPYIGLAAFSVLITVGVGLLAGAKYKKWFWQALNIGALLGLIFVHWLIYQSVFNIMALCIFCMLVWSITWPIFWYTTLHNLRNGNITVPKQFKKATNFIQQHNIDILIAWYVLIIILILQRFWYYWSSLI